MMLSAAACPDPSGKSLRRQENDEVRVKPRIVRRIYLACGGHSGVQR
jgi:hypothetical protein